MKKQLIYTTLLAATTLAACKGTQSAAGSGTQQPLLQVCPQEWIVNKMPQAGSPPTKPRDYYILEGKRREIAEFDTVWVKQNCNLKPTVVQ